MATDSQRDLLTQIFQAQRRALIGTLYRMVGCLHTSEDLAHDAYLRVAKAARERPVPHLQAFLYQTARNLALDHLRRERLRGTFMSAVLLPWMTETRQEPPQGPFGRTRPLIRLIYVRAVIRGRQPATHHHDP